MGFLDLVKELSVETGIAMVEKTKQDTLAENPVNGVHPPGVHLR